jgi:hypothetical protein
MCFWGIERDKRLSLTNSQPSVSLLSRQCGILNIWQLHRPIQPVTAIDLLYFSPFSILPYTGDRPWVIEHNRGTERTQIFVQAISVARLLGYSVGEV